MARGIFSLLMLSSSYGLNKLARLLAEKEEGDLMGVRLDPDFPYEVMGFDDKFFMAEPSDAHDKS